MSCCFAIIHNVVAHVAGVVALVLVTVYSVFFQQCTPQSIACVPPPSEELLAVLLHHNIVLAECDRAFCIAQFEIVSNVRHAERKLGFL
eukprot:1558419-Ditylum_brightwellii.AAC.1